MPGVTACEDGYVIQESDILPVVDGHRRMKIFDARPHGKVAPRPPLADKSYVSPWRLADVLAEVYIVLTSARMAGVARWRVLRPVVVCGRSSLPVFALGCLLSLIGRLIFRTVGVTVGAQVLVNAVGLGVLLALGWILDARKAARAPRPHGDMTPDAARPAE